MGLFGKSKFKKAFEPFEVPGTPGIGDGILAETKPAGFWQGGEKFGVKDGIAGILAVLGDAFTQRGGGQSNAVQSLAGSRLSAMEMAKQQAQQEQVYKQLIAAGVDPAKAGLVVSGAAKYGDVAPKPEPNNDTQRDYDYIKGILGEDMAKTYLKNKADPPAWRQGPDGQFYRMDTAPDRPVGKLTPITGGGVGNGAGGFSYRR